jgi:pyridoxal phosphate enzyme (YggS family)
MGTIKERFDEVNDKIARACEKSQRSIEEVKLIVVTKNQPVEKVNEVIDAGAKRLGENYPEQLELKLSELEKNLQVEWHMIGHIQSRKVRFLNHFSLIHSIDRFEIAGKIDRVLNRPMSVLLEVNLTGEETKHGFEINDKVDYAAFSEYVNKISEFPLVKPIGLMCMPPLVVDAEENRAVFRRCRLLLDYLQNRHGLDYLTELSMGTSQDYMVAIEEGATFIRVGEAIMGKR